MWRFLTLLGAREYNAARERLRDWRAGMRNGAEGGDDKLREVRAVLDAARARFANAPDQDGARGELVRALTAFGDLSKSRGDLDGALASYREGLSVARDAAALAEKIGSVLVMKSALAAHGAEARLT